MEPEIIQPVQQLPDLWKIIKKALVDHRIPYTEQAVKSIIYTLSLIGEKGYDEWYRKSTYNISFKNTISDVWDIWMKAPVQQSDPEQVTL